MQACAPDGAVVGEFNRASCGSDYRCKLAVLSNPAAYVECRVQQDCAAKTSDDYCMGKAGEGGPHAEADECAQKYAECKAAGGKAFSDDDCAVLPALKSDLRASMAACIAKPCEQVSDCVNATVSAYAPDCN